MHPPGNHTIFDDGDHGTLNEGHKDHVRVTVIAVTWSNSIATLLHSESSMATFYSEHELTICRSSALHSPNIWLPRPKLSLPHFSFTLWHVSHLPAGLRSSDPPAQTLLAFFIRYPNPFARHVLSVDVLDRWIDAVTGQIHTKRLILKRGILPKWAAKWLPLASNSGGRGLDAWVMEDSVVDPPGWGEGSSVPKDKHGREVDGKEKEDWEVYKWQPRLKLVQGNLNHRKFMHIVEGGDLRGSPSG